MSEQEGDIKVSDLMMEKYSNFMDFLEKEISLVKHELPLKKVEEVERQLEQRRRINWGGLVVAIDQTVLPWHTAIKEKDDALIGMVAAFFPEIDILVNLPDAKPKIDRVFRYLDFFCDCVVELKAKNERRAG